MDRKKTILIAVMINAGLLAVLFIAAMTMQDESVDSMEMSRGLQQEAVLAKPLFNELAVAPSSTLQPIELIAPSSPTEPVVHKLPPAAPVLPAASAPSVVVPVVQPFPAFVEISVQKGDNLEKIARKYHTSVDELIKLNQLPSSFLKVGQCLRVPAEKGSSPAVIAKPKAAVVNENAEYYTMKVGDNPWSIAMKHHIKVDELLKLNGLNEQSARKLKPGDRLRIR